MQQLTHLLFSVTPSKELIGNRPYRLMASCTPSIYKSWNGYGRHHPD